MKLALITYNAPHLKTEQVALGLAMRGLNALDFFALPFKQRPNRSISFAHRPDQSLGARSGDVAASLRRPFIPVASPADIPTDGYDYFIISGAGLLPESFVEATMGRVVNSHPGIIPLVRGLDAFKWAILDQQSIGNTLHFIDAEADAGEVFAQAPTPVFATDTLEGFARRHYELEIDMMIGFEEHLARPRPQIDMQAARPARMRMPAETETGLFDAFEAYKTRFAFSPEST